MNIVEVKNLSFGYDKTNTVLENLSLNIEENSINAILGANGSGKSTLLDCLVGVNKYEKGSILISGKEIHEYSMKEFAREVTYISQSTNINIDYTVREFILFGRNPYLNLGQSPSEDDYNKVQFYAEKMGIEYLLDKTITKISGGERQLAFICRALTQESKIFIFDEPLAALDFGNQNKLLMIFKILKDEVKTIIFSTHNPNQVLDFDCNVIVVNNKTIIANGKSSEVINKELLEKIYKGKVCETKSHFTFSN
jgi:iron complex transport system ATP-binding protein